MDTRLTATSTLRKLAFAFPLLLLLVGAGCKGNAAPINSVLSPPGTSVSAVTAEQSTEPVPEASPTSCNLPSLIVPAMPTVIPGYTEVDPATGLHMTGTVQVIDISTYHLEVTGHVDHPLKLSYDDLRCMPKIEKHLLLTCPGFFQDEATWAGVPLAYVLDQAGVQAGALHIKLYSADGYYITMPLDSARGGDSFLAYELEGETLPRLHGFPLRAVFPGMAGSNWVKWLVEIEVY